MRTTQKQIKWRLCILTNNFLNLHQLQYPPLWFRFGKFTHNTGNIHKLGRLIAHEWWTVTPDKEAKSKERYVFLFKSRLLVCKVRRISDDRSVFVLKDIVKLPDVQLVDQPQSATFEVHSKSAPPQTFTAHHEDVKVKWLREIGLHANDPLALHEHTVDDLRIDPSQVKADTDTEAFKLPPRIDAHEPESVKPSEVAKDHYLPHPEKTKPAETKPAETPSAPAVAIQQETKIEEKSSVQSTTSTTLSKVESKSVASTHQVSTADTKQVVANSQRSSTVQSSVESTKTATVESNKPSPQPEKTEPKKAVEVKPAVVVAPKVTPKSAPQVEPKTEYIVTEPQSLNASSVSVNTIADIGTRAQIQGKRAEFSVWELMC